MFDASVIHEITDLEIVGPVEHKITIADQRFDVRLIYISNDRFHIDLRIDLSNTCFGGG